MEVGINQEQVTNQDHRISQEQGQPYSQDPHTNQEQEHPISREQGQPINQKPRAQAQEHPDTPSRQRRSEENDSI